MNSERDRVYLAHILECIDRIREYTNSDRNIFMNNGLVQDAVLRRLQTMAESTQRPSDKLKFEAPEVDWRALSGFRNVLVHNYLNGVDLERVWNAIACYLPELQSAVERLYERLNVP
jgi:uncharacterized protein with HEPN domain